MADWFLALDGDDIGRRLELHILTEDIEGLKEFIASFEHTLGQLYHCVEDDSSVKTLLRGGDSLLIQAPESKIKTIVNRIRATNANTEITFSGGYGNTLRDAYLALKIAKASGKRKIYAIIQGELCV